MKNSDQAYLGTGWGFPPTFSLKSGNISMVSAEEDICESLQILLSTSLGERVMQPTYGCDLQDFLFEALTPTVASSIKEQIRTAILDHEPRIRLEQIDLALERKLDQESRIRLDQINFALERNLEGILLIALEYTILSTNSRFSFVYPFYLKEGSGILPAAAPNAVSFGSQALSTSTTFGG